MGRIFELYPGVDAEDHLWAHGLMAEDAYEILDVGDYKVFPNPGHSDRVKVIGRTHGGELLTIVITRPDESGRSYIVTGWRADNEEATLYSRPGGTQHA